MNKALYYQMETKNKSFLDAYKILKSNGVNNNRFHLVLFDKGLVGVDPHDPNLDKDIQVRIIKECQKNIWYFLREVIKVRIQGGGYTPLKINVAGLAQIVCMINKDSALVNGARQTFKDGIFEAGCIYYANFLGTRIGIVSKCILPGSIATKFLLPEYINFDPESNFMYLQIPYHKYKCELIGDYYKYFSDEEYIIIDEYEFINGIDKVIYHLISNKHCVLATSVISDGARNNGVYDLLDKISDFTFNIFDTAMLSSKIEHIQYHYSLLVENPTNWYKDMCIMLNNDPDAIRKEILLNRLDRA